MFDLEFSIRGYNYNGKIQICHAESTFDVDVGERLAVILYSACLSISGK